MQNKCLSSHFKTFRMLPFSLSDAERKLVVIDSFSDVLYLVRIPDFFTDQGSNESSSISKPSLYKKF